MRSEDAKILQFNQYQISDKAPIIIRADLKCIIEKIDGCKNNPENLFTTKLNKYIASCFSMSSILSFKSIEKQRDVQRGENCMKKFCESLRQHAVTIINFKKKKNEVINKRAAGFR